MSARKGLCTAAISLVLLAFLGGCSQIGTDIRDRLSVFMITLNAPDRTTLNTHFDQSLTGDLPLMDAAWWNLNFPAPPDADHLYGITLLDYEDPANVLATIMGPPAFNANTGLPRNAVFVMSRDGTDWLIRSLSLDGGGTPLIE